MPPAPGIDMAEEAQKLELASAVRKFQARGVKHMSGKGWGDWIDAQPTNSSNGKQVIRDPAKQTLETLNLFLNGLQDVEEGADVVGDVLRASDRRKKALKHLRSALASVQGELPARLLRLVELTQAHKDFGPSFCGLGIGPGCHGWARAPAASKAEGSVSSVESLFLCVDCEMVETTAEQNALARVCASNAAGEVVLDKLVKPEGTLIDLRTAITGIKPGDLESLECSREDVLEELRALMSPLTVLVGHTLHKDLETLRLEAPLIVDISLLYGIESASKKRPGLAHLVECVLGRSDFRGEDGQSAHDCADDVRATMELFLHRLNKKEFPDILYVAPPLSLEKDDKACTLFIHRLPDRDGVFAAISMMFCSLPNGLSSELKALNMVHARDNPRKLQGATALFSSRKHAEDVFLALKAEAVETDNLNRAQKLVSLRLPDKCIVLICVRPVLPGIGKACLSDHTSERTAPAGTHAVTTAGRKGKAGGKGEQRGEGVATDSAANSVTSPAANRGTKRKGKEATWHGRGWPGWRRAMDEVLGESGGSLPWKKLCTSLVERRREQVGGRPGEAEEGEEMLSSRALSAVPEEYLSSSDSFIRMPKRAAT